MRNIIPLFFTFTIACAPEYGVEAIDEASDNAGNPDSSYEVPENEDDSFNNEDTEEDEDTNSAEEIDEKEDLNDPGECGFLIYEGFDSYEETWSHAIFSHVGDDEIDIRPGEPATFQFAVTAHSCGDIELQGLMVVLSVTDYEPASWVTRVEEGQSSTLDNPSGDGGFESIDGYNCNEPDYDSQLFYQWDVEVDNPNIRGEMDEIYIEAGHTETLEFNLIPTKEIEPGTQFDLYLLDPSWIDIETGVDVWDSYYYLPSFEKNTVGVRVTVTD